jgi:hypothetical protein
MRPYFLAARTLLEDPRQSGPVPVPDRRSAWMLRKANYVDVAWHIYQATGGESLLRRTASDDQIDRIHVSGPLAPAISDHHGVAIDVNTEAIDRDNVWTYR